MAPDGSIGLDTGSNRQGRGAYVCRDPRCISKAVGQGAFVRRLKGGSIQGSLEKRLLEEVQNKSKEADG